MQQIATKKNKQNGVIKMTIQKNANENSGLYDFAINQPQIFATAWQRVENAINGGGFDNNRFNHYKQAVKNQAIKLFNSGKYRPLSIHAWQCKLLNRAVQVCKPENASPELWQERKAENKANFSKMDKIALSFKQ